MSKRATLLAVRHGQSEWNLMGRWQGQADPALTAVGERQAELAAEALLTPAGFAPAGPAATGHAPTGPASGGAAVGVNGQAPFDRVVTSDLQRARRTGEIIAEVLGIGVTTDSALRERRAGPWEGLTRAEIDEQWPGAVEARRWPPGFEDEASIAERLLVALRRHLADGGRVLLIGHAGVLLTLDARVGLADQRVPNLAGRWFGLEDAASDWGWDELHPGERIELVPADVDLAIE